MRINEALRMISMRGAPLASAREYFGTTNTNEIFHKIAVEIERDYVPKSECKFQDSEFWNNWGTCSLCKGDIYFADSYCKHCGARIMKEDS